MKLFIVFVMAVITVAGQSPTAMMINTSRPGSGDFQVGDKFQIIIAGAPNLPVSVRTMRQGRTDWGPVIAHTDASGRWSTEGQFEKQDFGGWREVWTVGGKLANPVIDLSVGAPCIPGGRGMIYQSGPNERLSCDTASGPQSFVTPSGEDLFRTPDGRTVSGHTLSTIPAEEYRMEIMESMMGTGNTEASKVAAEAGDLIMKMIGVNTLTEVETKKVLSIIRAAYLPTPFRAGEAEKPAMLALLEDLANQAEQESLKTEILEMTNFVRTQ